MNEAKHTHGPWTFSVQEQFGEVRFYVAQAEGAPFTASYSDVSTLIAQTVSGERFRTQEANARLIAAAPELLDALRGLLALEEENIRGCDDIDVCAEVQFARAAIAKATGRAAAQKGTT